MSSKDPGSASKALKIEKKGSIINRSSNEDKLKQKQEKQKKLDEKKKKEKLLALR